MSSDKEPPIINWDVVIQKSVRSSDGQPVGKIVAEAGGSVHIESAGSRGQWIIPKEHVAEFNGAEVVLDLPEKQLNQFETAGP